MDCKPVAPFRKVPAAAAWVLLLAALPLVLACERKPAQGPPPVQKVTVSTPIRRSLTDFLELTGTTQAINTVQLRARVEGYLDKVLFKDGDMVKKDQPLFIIQQNTYQSRLQQAEGNVLAQRARIDHAKNELARFTNLYNQKAAAQTDVENWRFERDSSQAALMTAEAQRDLAKYDLAYTTVLAPFDGRIDRRLRDPGNVVGSGESTVLAEISQIDPLYVYFNVGETDLTRLMQVPESNPVGGRAGKLPVQLGLTGEQGYPHDGYLDFAATSVTPTTGTLLLRGVFPNRDAKMLPGQFARVRVPVGAERSLPLVPVVALGYDQLGPYVLVVNDRNVVERRNVKTGATREGYIAIEEGLNDNERVVVNGLLRAAPGRPVDPVQGEAGKEPPGGKQSGGGEKGPGK
ncbi:MAG: efflux RND transporter periplasmic adaptor subunit [Syntrophobacteraceae bacterium]